LNLASDSPFFFSTLLASSKGCNLQDDITKTITDTTSAQAQVERRSKKKHTASASASITQAKNHQFLKGKRRTRRRASEPILTTLTKMKNMLMRLHNPTLVP
jgi:hypothetical protein